MYSRASAALLLPLTIFATTVAAELVIITEYASACSAVYTSGSKSLTVVQSTVTVQPTPLSDQLILDGKPFVLELDQTVASTPRKKRQPGKSYLQDNGRVTADKNDASLFHIDSNGQLNAGNGQVLSTNGIVKDMTFAVSSNTAAISTSFLTHNLTLAWQNEAFEGGMADLYRHSGQNGDMILAHFTGPVPASWERISLRAVQAGPYNGGPSGYGPPLSSVSTIISSGSTTIGFSATPGTSMMPSMGSMSTKQQSASSSTSSYGLPSSSPSGSPPTSPTTLQSGLPLSMIASPSSSMSSGSLQSSSSLSATPSASSGSNGPTPISPTSASSSQTPSVPSNSGVYTSRATQTSPAASTSTPSSILQSSNTASAQTSSTSILDTNSVSPSSQVSSSLSSSSAPTDVSSSPSSSPPMVTSSSSSLLGGSTVVSSSSSSSGGSTIVSSSSSSSGPTVVSTSSSSSSAPTDISTIPSSSSAPSEGSSTTQSSSGPSATGGTSEDGTCGTQWDTGFSCSDSLFGDCCSSDGYCGTGDDYCGTGCQAGFGSCDGVSAPSTTVEANAASSSSSPEVSPSSMSNGSPSSSTTPSASLGGSVGPANPSVSSIISQSQVASSATTPVSSSTSNLPACPSAACADSASSSTTCDSPYGNSFQLSCGTRNTGTIIPDDPTKRDISSRALTSDVTECLTFCDRTPGCVAINFEDGVCTRFSSVNGTEPAPGSSSASRSPGVTTTRTVPLAAASTALPSSMNSVMSNPALATSTTTSNNQASSQVFSSSTSSSSPTTSSASPSGTACPGIDGGMMPDGFGNNFMIGCGADTSGNAFTRRTASSSWRDCFDACNVVTAQGETCTGFTYVGGYDGEGAGYCNLKNQADLTFEPDQGGIFVGAIKMSNGTSSSMSSQQASSSTVTASSSALAVPMTSSVSSQQASSSTTSPSSSALVASMTSSMSSSSTKSSASPSASSSSLSSTIIVAPSSSSASATVSRSASTTSTNPLILSSPTPCNFGDKYIQDDAYCRIDLPFAVRMYQQSNQTVYASSNGFLGLGAGSASSAPQSLPADETQDIPPSAAFPYWMDLCIYPGQSPSQAIYYQIGASSTNVTFEYYVGIGGHQSDGVVHFTVDYDSILPGIWTYHYYSLGSPAGDTANGRYASVGIQGLDQNGEEQSSQYSYRSPSIMPGLTVVCNTNANTCVTKQ